MRGPREESDRTGCVELKKDGTGTRPNFEEPLQFCIFAFLDPVAYSRIKNS